MDIALDKVCELILRLREIDMKDGATDPASGSNPTDDGAVDVLTADPDDPTEEEVREVIAGDDVDERHDLVAIAWIGRGDFEPEEWADALRTARERETQSTAITCSASRNIGDLLDEGLASLGRSCA
jgi:hypothetical protein